MKTLGLFALTSLALLSATQYVSAQKVELQPRWNVGSTYVQQMKMQQETKMEIGGQKMNQAMTSTQEVATKVAAHESAGLKRLTQKYQRMSMDMEMAGQKMHFDSAQPDATVDPMGISKAMTPLIGKELRLVMNAGNEVVEVENLEEITKPMTQANPMAAQMMTGMFNKEMISQSFKQVGLKALPGKPVQPGDSWPYSVTMTLPQIGVITLNGKYTFTKMVQRAGGQCAELTEEGTVAMNLDAAMAGAAANTPGAPKMDMKVKSGTVNGTIWFDPMLGAPRESSITQALVMQMSNPMAPGESITIPMTQTIGLTLLKVEGGK